MIYCFKCLKCEYRFDVRNVPMVDRDKVKPECPDCGSKNVKRVLQSTFRFSFAENPNVAFSAKSDKYWESAERNRVDAVRKRQLEREEKVLTRDPETIAKIKRRADNQEQLGRHMQDPGRIAEAITLRKMIGEKT